MEATPVFYPVQSDLSIDPTDVTRKLTQAAKCVIAVHYFGFLQGLGPLSRLCQEHGAKLIEDCAHCLFGRREDTPVGGVGDFAFGSLAKFFPTYDGGCLVSAKELGEPLPTQRGGLAFQLKSIVNALERSHAYARLQPGPLWDAAFAVKDGILRAAKSARADNASRAPSAADCGYEFEPRWRRVRMSLASTAIMNSISTHKLVEARRTNYEQLLFGLANVPGGRPLRLHLPDEVVPFMFPFRVDDPERVFPALKARGIPMQRWDDAETTCPVSAAYSRELLFFPVHQGLTVEDMDWISATVREVLFSDSR
jgi:dTDP-4-amino-4,6-dideoxygalactose transaminase